jgi:FAD-dependent urate hydroxylase
MTTALIIGSGIAGPVTAIALRRAGIDATVYEAYDESAGLAHGVYVTVAVNGLRALRAIDAHQPVLEHGFPTGTIEFFSGTGKHLADVPIGPALPDGTVTHTIKRADLYRAMTERATDLGIRTEYGKRLVAAETTPSGRVVARFADGTHAEGDMLIGADGIHSITRRIIDPGAPAPRYTGLGNIGGFARGVDLRSLGIKPGTYNMVFGKRCFFGFTVSPNHEIWWFGNPPSAKEPSREELSATTSDQWKQRLLDFYRDDRSPATRIVEATTGPLRGTNQYDMPPVPVWHRGRMVVVGDAAHAVSPSSGQGVSLAAEDAVTLAACLSDHRAPAAAFVAYEALRRARVERVVAYGKRMGGFKAAGPVGRVIRDLVLPGIMRRQSRPAAMSSLSWLFDHHVGGEPQVA